MTYVTRLPRVQVVALRKESVDRNALSALGGTTMPESLSARRAWIEIKYHSKLIWVYESLSARRAWIEMHPGRYAQLLSPVALRKESVDRNQKSGQ